MPDDETRKMTQCLRLETTGYVIEIDHPGRCRGCERTDNESQIDRRGMTHTIQADNFVGHNVLLVRNGFDS